MSLISDALKKARQEAARQDSLRQGVPYAVGPLESPVRRNSLLPVLAGLGAGCLVAGILFLVAYVAGWGPFERPREEARVAEAPAPAAAAPPVAQVIEPTVPPPVAAPETTPPPQAAPPVVAAPEVRPEIEMRPAVPVEPQPAPAPAQAPVEAPPLPAPAAPAPLQTPPVPAPEGGLVDGQLYTEEVPVPGGGSVRLNGIAFSQDRPIAVISGRVMGPGESIEGFTVVAIEPGRVTLKGHGATVFLAPK